jgi:hypothetical protein
LCLVIPALFVLTVSSQPMLPDDLMRRFLLWINQLFLPDTQKFNAYVYRIVAVLGRGIHNVAVVRRGEEPRAIATYLATPTHPWNQNQVWVFCDHLAHIPGLPITKRSPTATHRITIIECHLGIYEPRRIKNHRVLWTADLRLMEMRTNFAVPVAQTLAEALLYDCPEVIDWQRVANRKIEEERTRITGFVPKALTWISYQS